MMIEKHSLLHLGEGRGRKRGGKCEGREREEGREGEREREGGRKGGRERKGWRESRDRMNRVNWNIHRECRQNTTTDSPFQQHNTNRLSQTQTHNNFQTVCIMK